MSRVGTALQLDERTWSTVSYQELSGRIMTVVFAYGVLTWNRFGLITLSEPRQPVRFILIGIYSWMAIALVIWGASNWGTRGRVRLHDAAVAASIAHVPLVALSFFMAIVAGFARILGPGAVLAALTFALWMPALLAHAFRHVAGLSWPVALGSAAVLQLTWLATTGRYLHQQVGHLL